MGWFFPYYCNDKESIVKHCVKNFKMIDHSVNGNVLYGLCAIHRNFMDDFGTSIYVETEGRYILICLLDHDKQDKLWGYKEISEHGFPYVFKCPKRILNKSTVADESGWRKACLDSVKAKLKLVENSWYEFNKPLNGETKWQYKRLKRNFKNDQMYWHSENGQEYRIPNVDTRFQPTLLAA